MHTVCHHNNIAIVKVVMKTSEKLLLDKFRKYAVYLPTTLNSC